MNYPDIFGSSRRSCQDQEVLDFNSIILHQIETRYVVFDEVWF